MIEAEPVIDEEPPPDKAPTPDEPPSDLTTNLKGDGPNSFGLSQGPGTGMGGGKIGGTGTGGAGSKWGRYNSGLGRSIKAALENHSSTKSASFPPVRVSLWIGPTGRITRARVMDSTGQPDLDRIIADQVLPGTQYEPQPEGMPSPIILRINARKP